MRRKIVQQFFMGLIIGGTLFSCTQKDRSIKLNNPHNIRGVVSYKRSFGDLNEVQLKAAKKWGISPIASREDALEIGDKLKEIVSCEYYAVDSLTHSIPFLVPKAAALVDTIGKIHDIKVIRGIHPALNKEAVRVVKLLPDFIPGEIYEKEDSIPVVGEVEGKKVNTYFTIPVLFRLQ